MSTMRRKGIGDWRNRWRAASSKLWRNTEVSLMKSLSRRNLLTMAPFAAAHPLLRAAAPDRGEMMWDYFARQYKAIDEARMKKLAAVTTKEQADALRQNVLRAMHAGIGAFPDRT